MAKQEELAIASLPKTLDGVSVYPSMQVYRFERGLGTRPDGVLRFTVEGFGNWEDCEDEWDAPEKPFASAMSDSGFGRNAVDCWSTSELALANRADRPLESEADDE